MLNLSNYSNADFAGWVPATVPHSDTLPPAAIVQSKSGTSFHVVFGMRYGDARMVWIKAAMPAGTFQVLDMERLTPAPMPVEPIAEDILGDVAGHLLATINGVPMSVVTENGQPWLQQDGVALRGHFRLQVSVTTWADLFVKWVPSERWFRWELVLNSANPRFGSTITETFPNGFELRIGDAVVATYGGLFGAFMRGETIAQGQRRCYAGVGAWVSHLSREQEGMLLGMLSGAPRAVEDRWYAIAAGMGVPVRQQSQSTAAFVARFATRAFQSMRTWDPVTELGITPNSGNTGAQADQCFAAMGTECFAGGIHGPAALMVRYMLALTYMRRPCGWRESNGDLLRWDEHPNLVLWGGKPHWHPNVGTDKLGLVRNPTEQECHGWNGPDREHWFAGSEWLAALMTGSDALQMDLEAQARLIWFGETVQPGLSTSGVDASRSIGWFGIVACALVSCLRDDATRQRVIQRARDRVTQVYLPALHRPGATWHIWDSRTDDKLRQDWRKTFVNVVLEDGSVVAEADTLPDGAVSWSVRYHYSRGWMPYQQACGAFGLYRLGVLLGLDDAKACAQDGARTVVALAYKTGADGALVTYGTLPQHDDGQPIAPEDYDFAYQGRMPVQWYRHAWLPLALWVRVQAGDEQAAALWSVIHDEARSGDGVMAWVPPADRATAALPTT